MLMDEKEAKLNNTALNSRAVVEKTGALQARIEDLEAQLAEQKACTHNHKLVLFASFGYACWPSHLLICPQGLIKSSMVLTANAREICF